MKKIILFLTTVISLMSCGTSETVLSTGVDLSDYKHCILGTSSIDGSADVVDVILKIENFLPEVLTIVSRSEAAELILQGNKVLTPSINITSEKWDGGHTYIAVSFSDMRTGRLLAVCKSSGIGMSIEEDREIALDKIKDELKKVFLYDSKRR